MTQAMRFDVNALDRASAVFQKVADAAERLERKLKDLDKTKVEIKPRLDTTAINAEIVALRKRLRDVGKGLPKIKLDVDLDGLTTAGRKVEDLRRKLATLTGASARVDIDTGTSEAKLDGLRMKMIHLRGMSPLKLRIEVDDQATAQLSAIEAAATALAAMRPTIQVDVDSAAALAQIAAVVAALGALAGSSPTVNINLNTPTFLSELARIRQEIRTLHGNVEIDANTRAAMEELARLRVRLAELSRMQQTVVVQADTLLARHQIEQIEQQLARLNGQTSTARVRVDLDKSWADAIIKVAALGRALAALKWPVAIAAAAPTLAALGGAAMSAVGAVGLLPGVLLAAGAAAATLKVGLSGVGDALKNIGDAKKFAESLKELAPAAQEFAKSVRDIAPAWKTVKLDTQQALFAGLGAEMRKLSSAYLPSMKSGLTGIAGEFNLLAKDFVGFATSTRPIADVDTIFRNTTSAMQAARPAAQNLAAAFLDIGTVGSELLPELAGELTEATGKFRKFIDEARRSGELKVWIQDGINTLKTLGSIVGNVGGTISAVFAAQRAAGADLLGTLDRITAGMERWAKSAEGQRVLVAIFNEIRRTIDAIMPGLKTLGTAVMDTMAAFANTGALQTVGQAFTAIAEAIAPLLPALGKLAGDVVKNLANALSAVAAVLGPIVSGLTGLLGALGPIPGAVIAMVIGFRALGVVNGLITGLGASLAGLATRMGASAAAAGGIATTFSKIGSAIPILGAAIIAAAAAWDHYTISSGEAISAMDAGGAAAQKAARELQAQTAMTERLENATGPLAFVLQTGGRAFGFLSTSMDEARASMTPLQQAQLDAAIAANKHADEVAQFGPSSQRARDAAEALATANDRVAAEQEKGARSARTHADAVRDLAGAMQSQIGSALAYEAAVKATADAHKAAGDALKKSGKDSDEYKTGVLNLARAQEQQAQAAQRQAEATGGAQLGLQAYNTELLRLNDGTAQGRDAFIKLASNLDNTGLAALSATAAASGLKTEIITLPDGRTVRIVTEAETSKLEQVKADMNALAAQRFVGTVTINGDATPFRDGVMQSVTFANGMRGVITLDGNDAPIRAKIGANKYTIDATTGIMTIDGNPAPGEADLSGLKLKVDATTGTITLEANPAPVDAAKTNAEQPTTSPHTITPETGPVDSAKTNAEAPTGSPHTVGDPVTDNAAPAKDAAQSPTSSTHTITVNDGAVRSAKALAQVASGSTHTIFVNAGAVTSAKALAQVNTGSTHTIFVDPRPVNTAIATAQQATQSLHTINVDDKAVRNAIASAKQPTTSMHTIRVNDGAVRAAKAAAQRPTSSTHTIHVRVVGGGVPRAAGAYATPRAEGAYAAPMAAGGMRKMSAARAEIVPPRQPRIIGDRMRGPEAFIPVNNSARSRAILNTTASAMGFDLVPRDRAAGGLTPEGLRAAVQPRVSTQGTGGAGALLPELRALNSELRALRGDVDHHTDNASIAARLDVTNRLLARLGSGGGSAVATAQAARTVAELGAF